MVAKYFNMCTSVIITLSRYQAITLSSYHVIKLSCYQAIKLSSVQLSSYYLEHLKSNVNY